MSGKAPMATKVTNLAKYSGSIECGTLNFTENRKIFVCHHVEPVEKEGLFLNSMLEKNQVVVLDFGFINACKPMIMPQKSRRA